MHSNASGNPFWTTLVILLFSASIVTSSAQGVVTNASESEFRRALEGGGSVRLEFDGELVLSKPVSINTPVTIYSPNQSATLSGGGKSRIFEIAESGKLVLTNVVLTHGQSTNGGAVLNYGELTAARCAFRSNIAKEGSPVASGGALLNMGTAVFSECLFSNNLASGSWQVWGEASGGAIHNSGRLEAFACWFADNAGIGSSVTNSTGYSGKAHGGALYNAGGAYLTSSTFSGNIAVGGSARENDVYDSVIGQNGAGGAIYSTGVTLVTNSTFSSNSARGGDTMGGRRLGSGSGYGGAIGTSSGQLALSFCTFASNSVAEGLNFSFGGIPGTAIGAAVFVQTNVTAVLHSSIIAYHTNDPIAGPFTDLGFNVCSEHSAGFTNFSSRTRLDPLLGGFAGNVTAAPPLALLPQSPVINLGDSVAYPQEDQRGISRPQHGATDPGSYEYEGFRPAVFEFSSGVFRGVEPDQQVGVTVNRRGNLELEATVEVVGLNGTAVEGIDYIVTNTTLHFAAGEQARSFAVILLPDNMYEETEIIPVALTNASSNAALGLIQTATIEIAENAITDITSSQELYSVATRGGLVTFGKSGIFPVPVMMITNEVTIDGSGRDVTIVPGGWGTQPGGMTFVPGRFVIQPGGVLKMREIVLGGGYAMTTSAVHNIGGLVEFERCRFETNRMEGRPADREIDTQPWLPGTPGRGGVIFNESGKMLIRNCSFTGNSAIGGRGGDYYVNPGGSPSFGGAIYNSASLFVTDTTFEANAAVGGIGLIYNANGYGGAIFNIGSLFLTNVTVSGNLAASGESGDDDAGLFRPAAYGGGLFNGGGTSILHHVTFSRNALRTTNYWKSPLGDRLGFNIASTNGQVVVVNTILAGEPGMTNCFGLLTDAGHNLSSDESCNFASVGSLNSSDPMLLPLADNGGFARTCALEWGSPAIDGAGLIDGVFFDQRGVPRPFGTASDIGAYEANHSNFNLTSLASSGSSWLVQGWGPPGRNFFVEQSTDLIQWVALTNGVTSNSGALKFNCRQSDETDGLFFRIAFE